MSRVLNDANPPKGGGETKMMRVIVDTGKTPSAEATGPTVSQTEEICIRVPVETFENIFGSKYNPDNEQSFASKDDAHAFIKDIGGVQTDGLDERQEVVPSRLGVFKREYKNAEGVVVKGEEITHKVYQKNGIRDDAINANGGREAAIDFSKRVLKDGEYVPTRDSERTHYKNGQEMGYNSSLSGNGLVVNELGQQEMGGFGRTISQVNSDQAVVDKRLMKQKM